jgi:hypothetical protein
VLPIVASLLLAAPAVAAAPPETGPSKAALADRQRRWTAVFDPRDGPRQLSFRAAFTDAQGAHELRVWRDGTARLRRRTDERLDLYVARTPEGALAFQVVDVQRKLLLPLDRASLSRLGAAADFPALSGVPVIPDQDFVLAPEARPAETLPAGSCRWYDLRVRSLPPARSRICWARSLGIPLLIRRIEADGTQSVIFEVKEATVSPLDPALLVPPRDLTPLKGTGPRD